MRLLPLLILMAACGTGRKELRSAEPVPGPTKPMELTLVTFNVHDLFVASDRQVRMRAIGRRLGEIRPDYIGLQEAFSSSHRKELEAELERVSGVAYESQYFPSGVMGSGLHVLTPHRIERAVFWRYSENGAWYQAKHGDWWAGKGAGMVRIAVDGLGSLDIFNTHCIASYYQADYTEDRTVQIEELVRFVEAEATTAAPTILLGDLNALISSPEYAPIAERFENLTVRLSPSLATRIDHILVRPHPGYEVSARDYVELSSGNDDSGESISLSDHAGLVMTVEIKKSGPGPATK